MAAVRSSRGGDEPPRRPGKRQRHQCESQDIVHMESNNGSTETRPTKTRSKQTKPRSISTGSYLPIEDNQKLYTRAIGNKVRELLIPCYKNWASIPIEDRDQIYKKVKRYFNIKGEVPMSDDDYKLVKESFRRSAASCYSRHKSAAHMHYKEQQKDPRNPKFSKNYKKLSDETKVYCLIHFRKFHKNKSTKNAENRKKQKYPCYQGSKSLVAHNVDLIRKIDRNKDNRMDDDDDDDDYVDETGTFIDLFHRTHTKKGRFVYKEAENDYYKLVEAREVADVRSGDNINERAVFQEVFGNRRGHDVGYGRKLRGSTSLPYIEVRNSSTSSDETRESSNLALKQQAPEMSKIIALLTAKVGLNQDIAEVESLAHDVDTDEDD
ncbi:hypothetical protein CASFOL_004750 [Castilleja foliolosa]|uniref:Uncharacterized protein n=1 Tax=Castilleja foliolosa TaxID=1961234 RepID=A0ABD3EBD3_9LAMI